MPLLEVQHVQKIYKTRFSMNQVEALKDIDFTVDKGDYVAIMGESGSGKSTLLNILAMLDRPTSGKISLNGVDDTEVGRLCFLALGIGYVLDVFMPDLGCSSCVDI